ncbi:MAG TPA: cupredoxin domain-containing protein [Sporichthyaceae bacterium]|nr:cupredoxin domain-containing protein [Sporichthyaceae bacterium]
MNRKPAAALMSRSVRIAAATAAVALVSGCGVTHNANNPLPAPISTPVLGVIPSVTPIPLDTPATAADTAELTMINQSFNPATLYVTPGTVITLTNKMDFICGVTDEEHGLRSGDVGPGASVHMTAPDTPGTYKYDCIYEPDTMKGKLVVAKDPQAAATKAAQEDAARSASPTPTATPNETSNSFSGGTNDSGSSPSPTASATHTHDSITRAQ